MEPGSWGAGIRSEREKDLKENQGGHISYLHTQRDRRVRGILWQLNTSFNSSIVKYRQELLNIIEAKIKLILKEFEYKKS